jgi:MEMO1 family protein
MSFDRADELASSLSQALVNVMQEMNLDWGHDFAIVISNDAVHYGDEDWGGRNYAPYGCDSAGYRQALAPEREIIGNCLTGAIDKNKLKRFSEYTVQDTNFRSYKWTWCGRYSVPFGLLTGCHLAQSLRSGPLRGTLVGYGNSVMQPPVPVEDLKMGKTAGASLRHWVGYAAIGYK